jgi:hypothetical protein
MIYCDSSFCASLYALDGNTARANQIYQADGRRPLFFSEWQDLKRSLGLHLEPPVRPATKRKGICSLAKALAKGSWTVRFDVERSKSCWLCGPA